MLQRVNHIIILHHNIVSVSSWVVSFCVRYFAVFSHYAAELCI